MTDVLTEKQRSYCMSKICGKNTKPELVLRKLLRLNTLKFYTNSKLPGKPDIVFPKQKLAVFVDGCFWHKCPRCFVKPATRTRFWMKKILGNVKRDKIINKTFVKSGWKVLRIWEHEIKQDNVKAGDRIIHALKRHRI